MPPIALEPSSKGGVMGETPRILPRHHQGDLPYEITVALWNRYRTGKSAMCPNDDMLLALSVDAGNAYRFVCTQCGTASAWFEAAPSGIQVRSIPPPIDNDYDGD